MERLIYRVLAEDLISRSIQGSGIVWLAIELSDFSV